MAKRKEKEAKEVVVKSAGIDYLKVRKELVSDLGCVAAQRVCLNRLQKMEELHKRINAIDRYLGESK